MNFKKNQPVRCTQAESWCKLPLKEGKVYTIKEKYQCPCGSDQLIMNETHFKINMICKCGHTAYRYQSYYEWRFRPLEPS